MVSKSERPTTPPAFDVAKYARDSDARIAAIAEPSPESARVSRLYEELGELSGRRSETRVISRPVLGSAGVTDETWARAMMGSPFIAIGEGELRRMPLDHRAGFILSLMDGSLDLDTVIEVSAMPRGDAIRLVRDLFESGVVGFR